MKNYQWGMGRGQFNNVASALLYTFANNAVSETLFCRVSVPSCTLFNMLLYFNYYIYYILKKNYLLKAKKKNVFKLKAKFNFVSKLWILVIKVEVFLNVNSPGFKLHLLSLKYRTAKPKDRLSLFYNRVGYLC